MRLNTSRLASLPRMACRPTTVTGSAAHRARVSPSTCQPFEFDRHTPTTAGRPPSHRNSALIRSIRSGGTRLSKSSFSTFRLDPPHGSARRQRAMPVPLSASRRSTRPHRDALLRSCEERHRHAVRSGLGAHRSVIDRRDALHECTPPTSRHRAADRSGTSPVRASWRTVIVGVHGRRGQHAARFSGQRLALDLRHAPEVRLVAMLLTPPPRLCDNARDTLRLLAHRARNCGDRFVTVAVVLRLFPHLPSLQGFVIALDLQPADFVLPPYPLLRLLRFPSSEIPVTQHEAEHATLAMNHDAPAFTHHSSTSPITNVSKSSSVA